MMILFVLLFDKIDDEFGEKTVSVLLDGEESDMIFIDHASAEMSVNKSPGRGEMIRLNCTFFSRPAIGRYQSVCRLWWKNHSWKSSCWRKGTSADSRRPWGPVNSGPTHAAEK
jgi:hypothetical protein